MQILDRRQQLSIGFVVLGVLLLPLILAAIKVASDLRSSANPAAQPQEVIISNITSTSLTVNYITSESVEGYATATGSGNTTRGTDSRDEGKNALGKHKAHYIIITNLKPSTEYTIQIFSDGSSYEGTPAWTAKTKPVSESISAPNPLRGKVAGAALPEGLVLAVVGNAKGNSSVISNIIDNNSTYTLDRNALTDADGKQLSLTETDMLLYINGLDRGKAKVQFGASKNPDDIILKSESVLFTGLETIVVGGQPVTNPTSTPVSSPIGGNRYVLDSFSESLLTRPYSTNAEKINTYAPSRIFISNLGSTGFTVNWLTNQATTGHIQIKQNPSVSVADIRDGTVPNSKRRYTHSVAALDGSIPAGTIFEFFIVSGGITFGQNIMDTALDYNTQYRTFVANAQNSGSEFVYIASTSIVLQPFKVIIPAAASTPPLPLVQQGKVLPAITTDKYQSVLSTLSKRNPALSIPAVDTDRDYLVAMQPSNGLWVSAVPGQTNNYSLSIGSTLNVDKTKYVQVTSGDLMQLFAYGHSNQSSASTSTTFTSSSNDVPLQSGTSFSSVNHAASAGQPLLIGFAQPGNTLTITLNGTTEQIKVNTDGTWQSRSEAIEVGLNELSYGSSGSSVGPILFMVNLSELPVTSISREQIFLILGLALIATGTLVYYRRPKYAHIR